MSRGDMLFGSIILGCGAVRNDTQYLGLSRHLAIDRGHAPHLLHLRADPQGRHLEHQGISWNDRPAEFGIFNGAEERYLICPILELSKNEDRTDLSEGLDLQYARHYWSTRKMPGKERL